LTAAHSLGIVGRLGEHDEAVLPGSLNLTDLELMMQWCNSTYHVLSRNESTDHVWRCLVPEEAVSHPFLMHGILALSALHLARTRNDHRRPIYSSLAVAHQNQALAMFRELLGDINDTNAKAMFSFASVVVLYTFGFPHEPNPNNPWTCIDDLLQIIVLIRGVQQVNNTASLSLRESNFKPLVPARDFEPVLPDDARLALEELLEANNACGAEDETHDTKVYEDTIDKLAQAIGLLNVDNSMTSIGLWAIRIKPAYVDLVREHMPLALVILLYHCVVLHSLRHLWCLEDWSVRVSTAIWVVLDDTWRPLARWPMTVIFGQSFSNET